MAAVLRVKRKASFPPEDRLIISHKRQKAESSSDEDGTTADQTILHFAGTLKDPTEDVAEYVAKVLPKLDAETVRSCTKRTLSYDGNVSDVSGKVSRLTGSDSVTDRFKVVNCQRSVDASSKNQSEDKWMTLIDIEDSWSISKKDEKEGTSSDDTIEKEDSVEEKEQVKEDMEQYVYDLYCAETSNNVWFESNEITIQHDYFVHEQNSDEEDKSTIDSNSESHWRNDYPDSDSDSFDSSNETYDVYFTDTDISEDEENEIYQCNVMLSTLRTHSISNESFEGDE